MEIALLVDRLLNLMITKVARKVVLRGWPFAKTIVITSTLTLTTVESAFKSQVLKVILRKLTYERGAI